MPYNFSRLLSISAWNVHGIFEKFNGNRMCKLDNSQFIEQLTSDIVFLSETHACTNDILQIEGYKCYVNCRSDQPSRLRGGLAVFIKLNIAKGVKLVNRPLEDMMWIKLDKCFFGLEKDLYICSLYISPSNSTYTIRTGMDKRIFDQLEQDIVQYSNQGDTMIIGDLNAHINSDELDYIENEMNDILDDCLPENYIADNVYTKRNTEIAQSTNNYGNQILDLCTAGQLRILNGRTLGDSAGRVTFYNFIGSSIDDYCICSASLLKSVANFTVGPYHPSLSDHCMVTVRLNAITASSQPINLRKLQKSVKWSKTQEEIFKSNLSRDNFGNICSVIDQIEFMIADNGTQHASSQQYNMSSSVDTLFTDFSNTLYKATDSVKRQNPKVKRKKRLPKKSWYDKDCDAYYRHVKSLSRKLSENPWDKTLRIKVAYEQKQYKKLLRKKHRSYKNRLLNGLLQAEKQNPSEFWKTVDQLKDRCKSDPAESITAEEWSSYFQRLMNGQYTDTHADMSDVDTRYQHCNTEMLSAEITTEEIKYALKHLKNKTACGSDLISNEMIKASCDININVYARLFNIILKTGIYPHSWRENFIKPLFKGGATNDPCNYRGIALSSCLSKFFCKVLHNRLERYISENKILNEEQIGFQKGCRTSDHVLTLKHLVDKAFKSSSYLFVCFVDFKKAFDTINRNALFGKLCRLNVNGAFLDILKSMYREVLFSVKLQNGLTESFTSKIGVKQGCILSPTLFSIYLNDLVDIFDNTCDPVALNDKLVSCLMYADDLVLVSKSAAGLQTCLDRLQNYCDKWDLTVNLDKTNIMIFNKSGRVLKGYTFKYNNHEVEIIDNYKYLGIIFKPSGSFTEAIKQLGKKANKALFCIKKCFPLDKIYTKPMIKLFDACVKPILLYCSEIWAADILLRPNVELEHRYKDFQPDKIHVKFCKMLLGVNKAAVNMAVMSELGRFPLSIIALKSFIGYWFHIVNMDKTRLIKSAYMDNVNETKGFGNNVHQLLNKLGFEHVWMNQNSFSGKMLTNAIQKKLEERYASHWKLSISGDGKLRTYYTIKSNYKMENYLLRNFDRHAVTSFVKLRISNSRLFVEEGRFRKIPPQERICKLCGEGVEDEIHFVTKCPKLNAHRNTMYDKIIATVPIFEHLSDRDKFSFIMKDNDYDVNKICIEGIHNMYTVRNQLAA